jgi:Fic family protein
MEEIKQALDLKAELDALRPIDKEQEDRIMQKFRLDWNYHSNHLEGNTLNYGETKALILFGITAQGKPLKDHFEMTGHNEAINWVIDMVSGERPLTENFIRELHTLLLKEPYEKNAQTPDGKPTKKKIAVGSYKTTPNHVLTKTGEMFYFATPEETPAEMTALLDWYKEKANEKDVNPILLAAEFHYKFIRIHPFDDGNGRTARILMNFILMQFGYPPVIIKTEDKENYFAVLQLADAGSIEPFIDYIAANLVRSLQIMIAGAKGESIEEPDDLDKEIALLEQRLENIGNKSNKNKNSGVIENLINVEIPKIVSIYDVKSHKFKKMYFKSYHNVLLGIEKKERSSGVTYIDYVDIDLPFDFRSALNTPEPFNVDPEVITATKEIKLIFAFNTFNILGFGEFNFSSEITFKLSKIGYQLYYDDVNYIAKTYDASLFDFEIEKIVNLGIKRHKDFIEQKIAEKENKSNPNS